MFCLVDRLQNYNWPVEAVSNLGFRRVWW